MFKRSRSIQSIALILATLFLLTPDADARSRRRKQPLKPLTHRGTLIENVIVVSPERNDDGFPAQVLIKKDKILAVFPAGAKPPRGIYDHFDGEGQFLVPGFINTLLALPAEPASARNPYLAKGFTTFVNINPPELIEMGTLIRDRFSGNWKPDTDLPKKILGLLDEASQSKRFFALSLQESSDKFRERARGCVNYLNKKPVKWVYSTTTPIQQLGDLGLHPRQLFEALTLNNAQMMGEEMRLGTIEPDRLANMLLMEKNPRLTLEAYDTISTIFVEGKVMEQETLLAPTETPSPQPQ